MSDGKRQRRVLVVLAVAAVGALLTFLAIGGIGESLVYYWSPSEMKSAGSRAVGATVRLGGLVAPDSIEWQSSGEELRFQVTDGEQSVPVHARTVPPSMFREGIGVVVEGSLRDDGVFETQRLMIKHDNQYQAPGEGDDRDLQELVKSLQLESGGA